MRRIVTIFALVFLAHAASATDQAVIKSGDVLEGRFREEKSLSGFSAPMMSQGHFLIAADHGLIWDVEKPFASRTIIEPSGLAQIVNGKTVTHLDAQKIPFLTHLYEMLGGAMAGNWQALAQDFEITRETRGDGWRALLTPRQSDNPGMPYRSIDVTGGAFVDKVVMEKPNGDTDILVFDHTMLGRKPLDADQKAAFAVLAP